MKTSVLNSPKAEGRKRQSENKLKQLALSIHNYHDVQVRFPAANFIGRNGHRHSWRTGMLPFLDQGDPYYDYRLKKTWNSPTIAKVFSKDSGRLSSSRCNSGHSFTVAPRVDGPEYGVFGAEDFFHQPD
jgi:hypothetical protein